MSNEKIIYNLDTNIIIEILRSNPVVIKNLVKALNDGNNVAISSVAYYEVMRGFNKNSSRKKMDLFTMIYNEAIHFPFDENPVDIAVKIHKNLRRAGKIIEDADIFIAAISIANDSVLVTDNVRHFERVPELKILNWKEEFV